MKHLTLMPLGLTGLSGSVHAAAQPVTATAGSFFQVLLGLIVVLALMAASAWALKRFGVSKAAGNATVKIVGGVNVGNRERVMVVEVADLWIVVGVAAGQVNALATMPRQESATTPELVPVTKNFSTWLKQTIDKRNGNDPLKN